MNDGDARFELDYRHRQRNRRSVAGLGLVLILGLLSISAWMTDVTPAAVVAGIPRIGSFFGRLVPDLRETVLLSNAQTEGSLAFWMYRWQSWLWLLLETTQMAALATCAGAAVGLVLSLAAAANLSTGRWRVWVSRRLLDLLRTVPDVVYAMIFVWAFGVGPLAGILALGLHSVGATGKLFAESIENAELAPWEGLRAAGASWVQAARFAILPQVLPNVVSFALLRFEINVRSATVIGFVGAGGIGQELYTVISFNYYQEMSAIIVLLALTVAAIDITSERVRRMAGSA